MASGSPPVGGVRKPADSGFCTADCVGPWAGCGILGSGAACAGRKFKSRQQIKVSGKQGRTCKVRECDWGENRQSFIEPFLGVVSGGDKLTYGRFRRAMVVAALIHCAATTIDQSYPFCFTANHRPQPTSAAKIKRPNA